MLIPLTQFDSKKVVVDLSRVSIIEEYGTNRSKISMVDAKGAFSNHLFIKESIDEICDIANKVNSINKNHQITIYFKKSRFD